MNVKIINGVVSNDHYTYISMPPHVLESAFIQKAKGRSSYKLQREFPELKKRYWGRRFWGRGYFSTQSTS
jgi:putative transposase